MSLAAAAGFFLLVSTAIAAACSRAEEPHWPTRNYSGTYSARVRAADNSCDAPAFAPGDTLLIALAQAPDNRAKMALSPVVKVAGRFQGDRLEAGAAVPVSQAQTGPPPSPARAESRDSLDPAAPAVADSIRYHVKLDFDQTTFSGEYTVEQPAMGPGLDACRQAFELEGVKVVVAQDS